MSRNHGMCLRPKHRGGTCKCKRRSVPAVPAGQTLFATMRNLFQFDEGHVTPPLKPVLKLTLINDELAKIVLAIWKNLRKADAVRGPVRLAIGRADCRRLQVQSWS
jgi:hypothetical protein